MKLSKLIITGAAVAAIAAPLAQAGNGRVQVAGSFVAPGQTSEAQLRAGHDPATRLVQIGGALVTPSRMSSYQRGLGSAPVSTGDSSSGFDTERIIAALVLGAAVLLLAAAMSLMLRNRRRPATAAG